MFAGFRCESLEISILPELQFGGNCAICSPRGTEDLEGGEAETEAFILNEDSFHAQRLCKVMEGDEWSWNVGRQALVEVLQLGTAPKRREASFWSLVAIDWPSP